MEPKQQPPYPLRMPPELREALEKEAALGKRSLNAEVVMRLQLTLGRQTEQEADLQARHRVVSRQLFDLEAQLMTVEEIRIARQERLQAQIAKNPSEKHLAPLHEAVNQAERVVLGLRAALEETLGRYRKIEARLAHAAAVRSGKPRVEAGG